MIGTGRGLCLAAVVVLGACADARTEGTTTLRFWAMGAEGEVVAQLARAFEAEQPDIRIDVQQIPWTAAHEKLLTAHVGDASPDMAQLGNTWIAEFEIIGALAPLDDFVSRSSPITRAAFFEGSWDANVVNDTTFGVPWYVDTRVLFYRSDLLAEAGYDSVPVTWSGWRTAMEAMKARMNVGQYPLLMPTSEWPPPVIFGLQAGSTLLRDNGRYGDFRGDAFRRAFEFYVGLFRDGLAPRVSGAEVANLYQEFTRGNIAMYISGPWDLGEFGNRIPAELQDAWMTAPLPGPDGPGVSMAGGSSLVMFRSSAHQEEAWRFIEYLSRPDVQLRFYALTGDLPAVRAAWNDSSLAGDRRARAFREQLDRVRSLPAVPEWEQIATKVFEYGAFAVRGRMSIDEALSALDRDVDALLEKRRWMLDRAEERP
ncbi:MAG TPA: sugar ABC transporter substrate-binding protein [Gemmatimonadaceae bacterium]|nr:sugar ABC transporter substrate-binding protein [Gemmatimonadaceae bacterium]